MYDGGAEKKKMAAYVLPFEKPVVDLVPERFRSRYRRAFERLVRTDPPRASYAPSRIVMLRADHTEAPVEIGAFLVVPEVGQR